MSAQGGTLARRGAVHLPIWPVAAVLAATVAAAIGMSVLNGGTQTRLVTRVTDEERIASSTAAVREQGAILPVKATVNPGMWTMAQAEAYLDSLEGQITYPHGLENPGAIVASTSTFPVGLENPGAYPGSVAAPAAGPAAAPHQPIMVNGEVCGQCR